MLSASQNQSPCQEKGCWLLRGKLKFKERKMCSYKLWSDKRELAVQSWQNHRENAVFQCLTRAAVCGPHWLATEKILWGFSSQWKKMESHLQYARRPFIKIVVIRVAYLHAERGCGLQCFAIQYSYSVSTENRGANFIWLCHLLQVRLLKSWSINYTPLWKCFTETEDGTACSLLQQHPCGTPPHRQESQTRL